MALVVLLRGINVGGHRTLRPSDLARQLRHLDAVSIGAAGTFVIRQRVNRAQLRHEVVPKLPFDAEIAICQGRDVLRLIARHPFQGLRLRRDTVRFVSVLPRRPRSSPRLPLRLPPRGTWLLRVLAREGRFVLGLYRRRMSAIGCLGTLDRHFGVPVITRNWNTMIAVAGVLDSKRR